MLFLFIICALSISVFAVNTYTEMGGNHSYFNAGQTKFNNDYANIYTIPLPYEQPLSSVTNTLQPLIDDYDGDGTNEIIFLDGTTLKSYVFTGTALNLESSITLLGTADYYSNLYSYDVDGDGKKEIIFGNSALRNFSIFTYDGSAFYRNTTISLYNVGGIDANMIFKCAGVNDCLVIYNNYNTITGSTSKYIYAMGFNFTSNISVSQVVTRIGTSSFCFSEMPYISYADYDTDGNSEMIFSIYDDASPTANEVRIFYLQKNLSGYWKEDREISLAGTGSAGYECVGYVSHRFTSPLVFDAETGGNLETIIGHNVDADEYRIDVFNAIGTNVNTHPSYLGVDTEAEGVIVSNINKANVFPVSKSGLTDPQNDYCVMGYSLIGQQLDLLCGSMINSFSSLDSIEFIGSYDYYNFSVDYDNYPAIWSINAKSNNFDGENVDEVFNTYGTFELNDLSVSCGAVGLPNYCDLITLFENGAFGYVVPIDAQNVGFDDYLAVTTSQIIYVEDKYSNSAPTFPSGCCSINPSNPIQINSTIGVTLSGNDVDENDLVSYRVIFFYGDNNQYSTDWTNNISDNQAVVLTGTANKTISISTIRLQIRDNYDPVNHITNLDYDMSVSNTGYVYGQSSTTIGGTTTTESNLSASNIQTISPTNPISSNVNDLADNFGFSGTLLYLLIGLLLIFGTWIAGMITQIPSNINAVFLISVMVLWFIIGVYLEFISVAIIIILVLIALAFLTPFIKHVFIGTSSK